MVESGEAFLVLSRSLFSSRDLKERESERERTRERYESSPNGDDEIV